MKKTLSIIALALATAVAPDPIVDAAEWAQDNLVLPDGPKAGETWDASETPQLIEILGTLSPHHPCNRVSVRKSAQTGLTTVGIAWLGTIIDVHPARAMVVFPTVNAVKDFNRDKLQPAIEETPRLKKKVRVQKSRDASGSTAQSKRFPGGSITLTGANSAADLRSKTIKFAFGDEIDEWPEDLDGQGDPMRMLDARQMSFHASGLYKKFEASTPTIKGASRIDAAFEAGDQRYWQVPCPHCGERQRLVFKNLKFDREFPYNAKYQCADCGVLIEAHHRRAMIQAGAWIAEAPGPGRHPSFHIDSLSSLLTTWDKIAEAWWEAQDDPAKLKAFFNLWLGESWEERGEAPDWQRLFARREAYPEARIPPGGLVITAAADIGKDYIRYEVVAWGKGRTSWSIDVGHLDGTDTADKDDRSWKALDEVYHRKFEDAYGNVRPIEAFAVDSGYNTLQVYQWCSSRPLAYAVDGREGWTHPAIGTPTKKEVTSRGKLKRWGVKLWPVGTWGLKAELYAMLRKEGRRDGQEIDPPGFCHYAEFHDQTYFQELTAEYLKEYEQNGRTRHKWIMTGPNHYLDARVYNMAMAAKLGLYRWDDAMWDKVAADRDVPPLDQQVDMETLWAGTLAPASAQPTPKPAATGGSAINQLV